MATLDKTRARVGFVTLADQSCYVMVRPEGTFNGSPLWLILLSDLLYWRGEELDDVLTCVEGRGDVWEWVEEVDIEWAPDSYVEVLAARKLFRGSRLARSRLRGAPAEYAPQWEQFVR